MKKLFFLYSILFVLSGCSLGVAVATSAVSGVISTGGAIGKGAVKIGASVTTGAIDLFSDNESEEESD